MKKRFLFFIMVAVVMVLGFMPNTANATTTIRQGNKVIITATKEEETKTSTVYAGEIKKDGATVFTYLYSDDVTRSSAVFDNLRQALSSPFSDMVPVIINEETEVGMKELSVSTLNGVNLAMITGDWTDAGNIATQVYNETNTDIINSNMYDVNEAFKVKVDNNDIERSALDNPIETNKRVITHFGTQTRDDVSFMVEEGDLLEVHNVDLTYLSEATTVIYTSVNVINPTTYTVTFNTDGGSTIPSQQVIEGSKADKPVDPIKDGYEFVYWFSDTGLGIDDEINADTTFTAEWIRKFNITSGEDQAFYLESDKDITIVSDGPFGEFMGFALYSDENPDVYMDDLTEGTDYVLEEGSTKLTLKNSLLKTLGAGEYYVEFYYAGTYGVGYTDTILNIKAGSEPVEATAPDSGDMNVFETGSAVETEAVTGMIGMVSLVVMFWFGFKALMVDKK